MIASRRTLLAAGGAFALAGAARAQPVAARAQAAPQPGAPSPIETLGDDRPKVMIHTDHGDILVALEAIKAPITSANFLRYVDARNYDGAAFYRAVRQQGSTKVGLIEGGIDDSRKLFPPIAHESTTQTGLLHLDGTLSMAREGPGTAVSDFFVCAGAATYLDANPQAAGDNLGYAAFGQVITGMEIVRIIMNLPTGGVARTPSMQGQILDPPVRIISMKRQTA